MGVSVAPRRQPALRSPRALARMMRAPINAYALSATPGEPIKHLNRPARGLAV